MRLYPSNKWSGCILLPWMLGMLVWWALIIMAVAQPGIIPVIWKGFSWLTTVLVMIAVAVEFSGD